jgi:hypothetical protein
MDAYRAILFKNLAGLPIPKVQNIAPDVELLRKKDNSFDGGRTSTWLADLEKAGRANFIGLSAGNKTIYVVSDRSSTEIKDTLEEGLRLMTWLTSKPLTWYWWDQPWIRNLPAAVDPGPEHVNGGWAIPGVPEVHVYRREEALKVMIHEAIHACLLDVKRELVEPVLAQFEAYLGRKLWPHLGECYTELLAEFLWSIHSKSLEEARSRWTSQLKCSTKQAGQVWARIHDSKEDERTNVFAYYILKWVLMGHPEVFLDRNACVSRWFIWFQESLPKLQELSSRYADSEYESLSLAMTCDA